MQQKQRSPRSPRRTRAMSLLLALVLILGLVPGFTVEASAHWADGYLNQLVEWGFIRPDQANSPDGELTRADFMAITNRAYGYDEVGETPFTDVAVTDWFYDDVGIAYNARYINGTSPTTASPNDSLNRETAATILGRNMMLQESTGEILDFTDAREISSWARGTVKSSLEHYLVGGYDDGTFKPQKDLSWGEMAAMLTRIVGTPLQEEGDYSLGGVFGNVTISSDGVTLRDTVISGDLYITGGVGLGGVKLENVTVLGRIIASGTGESEGGEASILLRNVTADELLVDNLQDHYVTLKADGITDIGNTTVRTSAYIEDNTPNGMGLKYISLEGTPNPETGEYDPIQLDLAGRIEEVVNRTPNSQVRAAKGTVKKMTIDEAATDSSVIIDRGAVVKELNLDVGTEVTGEGDIEKLVVNAPGSTVEMLPDQIEIRPGITAEINGEEMDSVAAEESSMEPLILAGYPQAQDIAPNSITAVFSTNKKGTIYWAVSAINDGSVDADDLIKPPVYGSIAVRNGSVTSPRGNEEVSSAVNGLTAGGNYYLSAVLVDDRGHRSPTKVISFTTPDNTVPDFVKGYPYMSKVSKTDSIVVVMPTKSCKLYYALLPEGAVAPTPDELRTGAVIGNLGYGVRDVTKNTEDTFRVNDVVLEEQTRYVLYLWLTDADGANSSKVVSLTFTTDDDTPPVFIVDPTVNKVQATSVSLTFRLNENGTVYWVAVPAGTKYPKPQPGTNYETAPLDSDYAILQVVSGMNIGSDGKSGRVTCRANADGTITVSGLKPESAYDFYYVAKDNAGADRNYSADGVKKITIHTLDESGPKVTQTFTKFSGTDNTTDPTSNTDIVLTFSEDVRYADGTGGSKSFSELWTDAQNGVADAKSTLVKCLENSIKLHKVSPSDGSEEDVSSTIDYSQVTVKRNTDGTLDITFPNSALKLENGGQYYFTINNLTDASDNQNPIVPSTGVDFFHNQAGSLAGGHNVPVFTVEPATIIFTKPGVGRAEGPYKRNGSTITEELERIDMSFRMRPNSTRTVSGNISYDILFFTNNTCAYDLYYRVIDEDGKQCTGEDNKFVRHGSTLGDNTPDSNGWIYLGNSGDVRPEGDQWRGRSLSKFYNNCDSTNFPRLQDLSDDLRYEFVITMTKVGQLDTAADPNNYKYWNETVQFEVNAAADQSNELDGMVGTNGTPTRDTWNTFKGKAGSGISRSVGRWLNPESKTNQDTLELSKTFNDSRLPEFAPGAPSFSNHTSNSVDVNLALKTPGTVYYAVGKAEATMGGVPEIPTYRDKMTEIGDTDTDPPGVPNSDPPAVYITKDGNAAPPTSGALPKPKWMIGEGGMNEPEGENKIIRPLKEAIFEPESNEDMANVITGSFKSSGLKAPPITIKDLDPNTTYYLYCVIKGDADTLSHVYIYQFTTSKVSKPKLNLDDTGEGAVSMWTVEEAAKVVYRVYTQGDARQIPLLTAPFSQYVDTTGTYVPKGGELPNYYSTKQDETGHPHNYTVLDALIDTYSNSEAGGSTNPNAWYPATQTGDTEPYEGGYSVFDIYASEDARKALDELIRTNVGSPVTWVDYGNTTTKGNEAVTTQALKKISEGTKYVILAAAQNSKKADGESSVNYLRDSFKAYDPIQITDPNPPNLIRALMTDPLTKPKTGSGYDGALTLTFDKPLYTMENGQLEPVGPETFKRLLITPTGTTVTVEPAGSTTGTTNAVRSFKVTFTNFPAGASMTIDGGTYYNASEELATEDLTITLNSKTETIGTGANAVTSKYYCVDVFWGIKNQDKDYSEFLDLGKISESDMGDSSRPNIASISLYTDQACTQAAPPAITLNGVGQSQALYAKVNAQDGTEETTLQVDWSSSNRSVITASGSGTNKGRTGTITAVGPGKATVTATVTGGNGTRTVTVEITVPDVTEIKLTTSPNSISFDNKDTYKLTVESPVNGNATKDILVSLEPANITANIQWYLQDNGANITYEEDANHNLKIKTSTKEGVTKFRVTAGSVTRYLEVAVTRPTTPDSGINLNLGTNPKR